MRGPALPKNSGYVTVKLPPEVLKALDRRVMDTFSISRAEVAREILTAELRRGR